MAGVSALAAADKAASALEGLELKPGYSMFVDVRSLVDTDAIVTASGTRADLDGVVFTAGLDRTFSNGAFIGGAMTYSNGDAGTPAPAQGAEGGGLQVSGYAGQRFGQAFVEAYAGIGALTFDTLRRLVLANGAQSLAGEVEGDGARGRFLALARSPRLPGGGLWAAGRAGGPRARTRLLERLFIVTNGY